MPPRIPSHPRAQAPPCPKEPSAATLPHLRPVFASEPYPVNLNLAGLPVLVVGGGPVAAHKIKALKRAGADVTVVAPAAIGSIADDPKVDWHQRRYRRGEAASYRLVVTATDDPDVNAQVARDGSASNVFVNSADDPENCSFTLMSVLRRGDLQVTVSTNGRSPALARWLRLRLGEQIDSSHVNLLDLLAEVRSKVRATLGTSELPGWEEALDDGLLDLVRDDRFDEARALLHRHLEMPDAAPTGDSAALCGDSAALAGEDTGLSREPTAGLTTAVFADEMALS